MKKGKDQHTSAAVAKEERGKSLEHPKTPKKQEPLLKSSFPTGESRNQIKDDTVIMDRPQRAAAYPSPLSNYKLLTIPKRCLAKNYQEQVDRLSVQTADLSGLRENDLMIHSLQQPLAQHECSSFLSNFTGSNRIIDSDCESISKNQLEDDSSNDLCNGNQQPRVFYVA